MDNEQLLQAISEMMDKKLSDSLRPVNNRLDKMESEFGNRLDKVESEFSNRLDKVESEFSNRLDKVESKFSNRLDKMEFEFSNRLDKVESEISSLKVGQIELKKEIQEIKHKVNDTYDLALDAWGQSTENREWLECRKATS